MTGLFRNRSLVLLLTTTLFLLVTPLALISLVALDGYQHFLMPELRLKADSVGRLVARKVERAIRLEIPLDRLVGMQPFLGSVTRDTPDIGFVAVTDAAGEVLYASGLSVSAVAGVLGRAETADAGSGTLVRLGERITAAAGPFLHLVPEEDETNASTRGGHLITAAPIVVDDENLGVVHVGVPLGFFTEQLEATGFDVLIILLAALLIAFEILLLVLSVNLLHPLAIARDRLQAIRQGRFREAASHRASVDLGGLLESLRRAAQRFESLVATPAREEAAPPAPARRQNLVVVRLLAFLFVVAEELARPFLPVYIERFAADFAVAEPEILASLPVSVFMLVAALTMALGGPVTERFERRRTFASGAILASLGLLGTALAQSYFDLVLWRALSAVGYGLAFVACQGYVIDHTTRSNRARGIAMFTGGIIAADISGPAVGGVLADHFGFEATLAIAGCVATVAAVAVWWLMDTQRTAGPGVRPSFVRGFVTMARSWRFWVLILFAALPAKFVLAGFLFFQVPLFLTDLGASQSEIGRIVMLYGLTAFFTTPLFAYCADRFDAHGFLVGLGGAVAGIGLLPILVQTSVWHIVTAVALLGLGQAMTLSSLLTVLTRIAHSEIERLGQASILGVFRLIERSGAFLGPLIVAWLIAEQGHVAAMAATGVLVLGSAVLFSSLMLMGGYEAGSSSERLGYADDGS